MKYLFKHCIFFSLILLVFTGLSPAFAESLADANLKSLSADTDNMQESQEKEETAEEHPIDLQLYQANIAVTDSSETERYQAFTKLLQSVLIKISANPKIIELPTIRSALKNAENFIDQFSYTHGNPTQLNAHFNVEQINTLLTKAGQPIFNQQRPPVIAWLIVHDADGSNHIVGSLSEDTIGQDWLKSMRESADMIGLPILFPFGDLEDLSTLSSKNLWKITPKKLSDVSIRYEAQNILLIKINADKTSPCTSEWSLLSEEEQNTHWDEKANTCQDSLQKGIAQTLHYLLLPPDKITENKATSLESLPTEEPIQTIHLSVTQIQSAEEYQQVLNDLQNQPNIVNVEIEKVTPARVFYTLQIKGNLTSVIDNLSRYSELQLLQKDEQKHTLEYTFAGKASANVWEEKQP